MQVLFFLFVAFYVFTMPVLFVSWHSFFRHDVDNLSPDQTRISIAVLVIATLAWPVILPFAYVELLDKFRRSTQASRIYQSAGQPHKSHLESASDNIRFSKN